MSLIRSRPAYADLAPADFLALRAELGATQEQLAADLDVTRVEISAWEAGAVRIPRHVADVVRWKRDAHVWHAAATAAGAPACPWRTEQDDRLSLPRPRVIDGIERIEHILAAHRRHCRMCAAHEAYAAGHPAPERPEDRSLSARWQQDVDFLERTPFSGRVVVITGALTAMSGVVTAVVWIVRFAMRITGLHP